MKVQSFKRLIKEDVEEQYRPLVEKIAFSVNPFAEEVIKALDNNLSIEDNFGQKKKEITVQVDSDGIPTYVTQLKTDLKSICSGAIVIRADNLTNARTYPTGCPFLSFTENNGVITVNHITGLPAGNKFKLKLVLYP